LPDYPTRPIDELTGLPYCFAPNPDLPAVLPRGQNHLREGDLDHHFPKVETKHGGNPVLELPFARMALMNLRVQWSTFEDHHDKWNKLPVIGPMQPRTPQQLAATVLFGLSMYIPPVALTLHNDHFVETWLDALERSRMVESGQIQVANEQEGINYLQWYVMAQEVDHIKQVQLDEFLHTFNRERKIYLAHTLAAKIVERAVEPFEGAYTKAYKQGMLSVRQASGVVRAPANPRDLVKAKLTTGRRFGVIMDAMAHRLAGHRDALLAA